MSYNFQRIKVLITSGCNSNCVHCFRNKEKNTELISFDKLKEIVDFGVDNGCHYFGFSGGEFFTHPNCYDLINYCLAKEVNIKILTNAIEIDIDYLKKIERKDLISFQVSIDGLEKAHDKRRGQGSFQKTIENVKKLYALGYKLTTKMVLDSENYMDFPYILEMPWFEKVLVLPMALYNGDAMDYDIEENMAYEEVVQIIYQKMLLSGRQVNDCIGYPYELAIKYNGNVYPCTEAREHDEFLIGNISDKTLEEVLSVYDKSDQEKLNCKAIKIEKCTKCMLGIYVSGHPLAEYEKMLRRKVSHTSIDFLPAEEGEDRMQIAEGTKVAVGGMIAAKSVKYTRNNEKMCFLSLEDLQGTMEIIVFPKVMEQCSAFLDEEAVVLVKGRANVSADGEAKVIAASVTPLMEETDENKPASLWLKQAAGNEMPLVWITAILEKYKGDTPVYIYEEKTKRKMKADRKFWVTLEEGLLE